MPVTFDAIYRVLPDACGLVFYGLLRAAVYSIRTSCCTMKILLVDFFS
jgi:hypothetical protein